MAWTDAARAASAAVRRSRMKSAVGRRLKKYGNDKLGRRALAWNIRYLRKTARAAGQGFAVKGFRAVLNASKPKKTPITSVDMARRIRMSGSRGMLYSNPTVGNAKYMSARMTKYYGGRKY